MKSEYINKGLRALLLAVAAFLLVCNALTLATWPEQTDTAAAGTLGAGYAPGLIDRRLRIARLDPHGALAREGAKVGDLIVFAHPGTVLRTALSLTEVVDLTLYADGQARQLQVRPLLPLQSDGLQSMLNATLRLLTALFAIVLAVLLVVRKGKDSAMLAFSASLLANAPSTFTLYLPAGVLQDFAAIVVRPLDYVCGYLFFLFFALQFPPEKACFKHGRVRLAFFALGAINLISTALTFSAARGMIYLAPGLVEQMGPIRVSCGVFSAVCSLALLAYFWRTSHGDMRNRVGWILLCIGISYVFWIAILILGHFDLEPLGSSYVYAENIVAFIGYAGFSYALLRHKVFNFGFAINRALVYTFISTLVLVAFGLTEFAVDKLLHFEGRQKNIIFDAVVALAIILSFHRIQHWTAHKVDHTFFHHWHEAAEKLRCFIDQAAHITSADILRQRYAGALEAFASSTGVAIYEKEADGGFTLRHATLPAAPSHIDANHALAVALRHRAELVRLDELAASLPGALALPMLLRGGLSGMILMAGKNNLQDFRPDEMGLLTSSAYSLAVQLDGVRIHALEDFAASLRQHRDELTTRLATSEREAVNLRASNLDLREANTALRALASLA